MSFIPEPPLRLKTRPFVLRLDERMVARIETLVAPGLRTAFMRNAIEHALSAEERAAKPKPKARAR